MPIPPSRSHGCAPACRVGTPGNGAEGGDRTRDLLVGNEALDRPSSFRNVLRGAAGQYRRRARGKLLKNDPPAGDAARKAKPGSAVGAAGCHAGSGLKGKTKRPGSCRSPGLCEEVGGGTPTRTPPLPDMRSDPGSPLDPADGWVGRSRRTRYRTDRCPPSRRRTRTGLGPRGGSGGWLRGVSRWVLEDRCAVERIAGFQRWGGL